MGERDHSIKCETCGLQCGGLNDYKCRCDLRTRDESRTIEDRSCGVVVEISDRGLARVAWRDGTGDSESLNRSCWVEARLLAGGRWIPMRQNETDNDEPPIYVVCRATALVVGASIKADVLDAIKGLP